MVGGGWVVWVVGLIPKICCQRLPHRKLCLRADRLHRRQLERARQHRRGGRWRRRRRGRRCRPATLHLRGAGPLGTGGLCDKALEVVGARVPKVVARVLEKGGEKKAGKKAEKRA